MASIPPAETTEGAPFVQARAAWKVVLQGRDLTEKLAPRLISLRLSEKLGEEADELEIVLHDADGLAQLPPEDATLTVSLGWDRGTLVSIGMVRKGTFVVDEVSWDGPPDKVTIRASSANFKDSFRTRKTRVWKGSTVADVVRTIAAEHDLKPRCHPDLAGKPVTAAEQHNKSDMQFLRDLGRLHDATATVKGGALIFAPRDATTTPSGAEMPTAILSRTRCASASWRRAAREKDQDGAEAQYHDATEGKRKTVTHGGEKRKRLKRVYSSEADAKTAATSETQRQKRASATLEVTLAFGNPLLTPGMGIEATGFRALIDQTKWRIASAEHTMESGGLKTSLTMEVAA